MIIWSSFCSLVWLPLSVNKTQSANPRPINSKVRIHKPLTSPYLDVDPILLVPAELKYVWGLCQSFVSICVQKEVQADVSERGEELQCPEVWQQSCHDVQSVQDESPCII